MRIIWLHSLARVRGETITDFLYDVLLLKLLMRFGASTKNAINTVFVPCNCATEYYYNGHPEEMIIVKKRFFLKNDMMCVCAS